MKKRTRTSKARHADLGPRLRRVEGQIRGIMRMVQEDKPCRDILIQVSAAREALRKAAHLLVEDHLKRCVNSPEAATEMLELLNALKS